MRVNSIISVRLLGSVEGVIGLFELLSKGAIAGKVPDGEALLDQVEGRMRHGRVTRYESSVVLPRHESKGEGLVLLQSHCELRILRVQEIQIQPDRVQGCGRSPDGSIGSVLVCSLGGKSLQLSIG